MYQKIIIDTYVKILNIIMKKNNKVLGGRVDRDTA